MTRAAVRERAQARRAADAAFREAFDAYMFECFAKPGFKLESEAQLAERFGVTRYKVRKAIEALNQAGVLERVKHGGSTVRSVTPEELADRADRLLSVAGLPAEEFEDAVSDLVCGLVPVIMDKVDPEKLAGLDPRRDRGRRTHACRAPQRRFRLSDGTRSCRRQPLHRALREPCRQAGRPPRGL